MHGLTISSNSHFLLIHPSSYSPIRTRRLSFFNNSQTLISPSKPLSSSNSAQASSDFDSIAVDGDDEPSISGFSFDPEYETVDTKIEKVGNNSRRIRSRIGINASLQTIWNLLTDYERLADFIPGLALCQLLEKREKFSKLYQIGEQDLAFGLKFKAKGIVDCYEKDLEHLPFGQRRDIEFKMVEGDFQTFEGKWSIVQADKEKNEGSEFSDMREFETSLLYIVEVEPKLWLPVGLVEGRLCKEIQVNLLSIRDEAHKAVDALSSTC